MPLKSAHGPFSSLEILSQCSPASTVQGPHCSVPGRLFASAHGSWTRRWARPSVRPSQSSAKRGDVLRSLDLSESSTYLAGDLRSEAVAGAGQGGGLVDPVDALEAFSKHMENFSSLEVKRLSEHFLPDIIHVLESDLHSMLQDLTSVHLITARQAQYYADWEKAHDAASAAEKLVGDVMIQGQVVMLDLWVYLFELQNRSSHPNLHAMLDEIIQNGHNLLKEQFLNKYGHPVESELRVSFKMI
ncbi:uncharacterized protein LOC112972494 isoform X1 [Apteryx rowi]|uniref:uncharacterized protein LOC112972494 isoform X1 n=1 Tax=Apteryx rowi TaxID=308060 RepID=UPI000E1DDE28|nr:uncharacterized protein LOC112972494 isoform X1 [Apteryx rowi]